MKLIRAQLRARPFFNTLTNRYSRLLAGLVLATFTAGFSNAETAKEEAVKVAFLYNFFKFIEWPAAFAGQNNVNLCLNNAQMLGGAIAVLEGKIINGKPLAVLREVTSKDLKDCQMLYIDAEENVADTIAKVKGLPVVTVSDKVGFIELGGMIGLVHDENRLGFEINLDSAKESGLHFSANLLKLAKQVLLAK